MLRPNDLSAALRVAYITGWRLRSEILTRQKHHVDLEAGWLGLESGETKNGEGRMFPLTPELAPFSKANFGARASSKMPPARSCLGFSSKRQTTRKLSQDLDKRLQAAAVPGRIPHDFRRSAVRNLERTGGFHAPRLWRCWPQDPGDLFARRDRRRRHTA